MIRLFAGLFSLVSIGGMFAVGGIAALVHLYGRGLPSHEELIDYQPKMLSRVYSGEGAVIAQFATEKRIFAPIDEVPVMVRAAFVSAEDKNFYNHPGIDAIAIGKAVVRYAIDKAKGGNPKLAGASGITQQVVKNMLVGRERALERKIKEGILAVRLDGAFTKDHILELYLNENFMGARSYGIMAASQNYFGKTMEELTPAEAAYLAALPKAPSNLHPVRDKDRAIARRNYVLGEMHENGYLTRAELDEGRAAPLETLVGRQGPDVLAAAEPDYFTSEVRRQLISEVGTKSLYEGGLTVRATVDPELQVEAARVLRTALEKYDRATGVYSGPIERIEDLDAGAWAGQLRSLQAPRDIEGWSLAVVLESDDTKARIGVEAPEGAIETTLKRADEKWVRAITQDSRRTIARKASDIWKTGDVIFVAERDGKWTFRQIPEVQGAFMAMDPHTGRVLALQGGFSYQASVFNRATQALRQPGSSFKPFVYAAALDAGYSPATIVLDAPIVVRAGGKAWRPKNSSNNFYGPQPLRKGLELSRNLMTVRIAQQVGMDRVADYAERFGVYENMPHHLSYALGAGETTLYQMVAAYGMFANGGKRVRPTVVDRIQDRKGNTLFRHDPRGCDGCTTERPGTAPTPILYDTRSQIMSPVTARQLISMMQGVIQRGTASRTVGNLGFPVAGKTGTTNDSRDAWFVGFSPNMVAGCFIGFDQPRSLGKRAYGGTLCGPVFKSFMISAMKDRNPGSFKGGNDQGLVMVKIDRDTGERLTDDATGAHVLVEFFSPGTEPPLYGSYYLDGDEDLFDTVVVADLPFSDLVDDGASFSEETIPLDASQGTGSDATQPQPPQPPGGGQELDLGTGGLY